MTDPGIAGLVDEFTVARHIKLGKGNGLAEQCIRTDALYIGYYTGAETLSFLDGAPTRWEALRKQIEAEEPDTAPGSLTAAINQMRTVIDDDGRTLWFTFCGTYLYWTFIDPSEATTPWSGDAGGRRRTIGWRRADLRGRDLHTANITTRISQVQAYQRTIREYADVQDGDGFNPVSYLRHLIRGDRQPSVVQALAAEKSLKAHCLSLIRTLTHKEFENFVDLIMVSDGWLRRTEVGGTMKDVDGEYIHATTGLIAKVQVKSSTSSGAIIESGLLDASSEGVLLYWIFHTASEDICASLRQKWGAPEERSGIPWFFPDKATGGGASPFLVLGGEQLAELALRKGLSHWLVQKAC